MNRNENDVGLTVEDVERAVDGLRTIYYIPLEFVQEFDDGGERFLYRLTAEDVSLVHPNSVAAFEDLLSDVGLRFIRMDKEEFFNRIRQSWDIDQRRRSKVAMDKMAEDLYEQSKIDLRKFW